MRKVLAIVRREFVERIRTRGFWVATVLGPLLFAAMILLPVLLAGKAGTRRIAVVDETTGGLGARVMEALEAGRRFRAERVPVGAGVLDSLTLEVGAKRLDGFLIVSDALVHRGAAEYRASNVSALATIAELERSLQAVALGARLEREGVNPRLVERARIQVALETKKISGTRTTGESAGQSFALAYIMSMILYMAISLYGMAIMNSVLEEKTSRVVEVLVSSVRPHQLMVGKLLGVASVSLLQLLIWVGSAKLMIAQRSAMASRTPGDQLNLFDLPAVPMASVAVFVFYFVGGFLLYAAMYAAVGAMASTTQEAQQSAQPVTIMLVVSLISMFAMLNDPGSTYSVVLSLIPFTAPIAMPVRWVAGSLPLLELFASMLLLGAGILGVVWVAARIYRVGILMTGKRPSLRELVRWVRTA